jgi:bacterioferritin
MKKRGDDGNGAADKKPFLSDITLLRDRARGHMEQGAATPGAGAARETLIKVLNDALASELVCVRRYRRLHFMAKEMDADGAAAEFARQAVQEQLHADLLAVRIVLLGGAPEYFPAILATESASAHEGTEHMAEMIKEDLLAERIVIGGYGEIIRYLGDADLATCGILKRILASEAEHAKDFWSLVGAQRL